MENTNNTARSNMEDQLSHVNALYNQKQQELKQATVQRQSQLEKVARDLHAQNQEKAKKLTILEREVQSLRTANEDQKELLQQYETRFVQIKSHIEQLNHEKQSSEDMLSRMNQELQDTIQKQIRESEQLKEDKAQLMEKLRDTEWSKDQEVQALERNIIKLRDENEKSRVASIQDVEKIKEEVGERFRAELSSKNQDMVRMESNYQERIDSMQRELNKLQVQIDQQAHIERDLRERGDTNRKKAEDLQMMIHKGSENERKEMIELQIKVSQLTQENTIKDEYHSKQVLDLKTKLQSEQLEKERLQMELKSSQERHTHELQLQKERGQLEKEREHTLQERQTQLLQDKLKEAEHDLSQVHSRHTKLQSQMQDLEFSHKKDLDEANDRSEQIQTKYEKQIRELRTQISMKNKDVQNSREEVTELENRFQQKTSELKQIRAQMQVVQSRYEECMAELDQNQTGHLKQISRQNQSAVDDLHKQIDGLRNENLDLKEVIRDLKKQRLVTQNAISNFNNVQGEPHMDQQANFYGEENDLQADPLLSHFQNVDLNAVEALGFDGQRDSAQKQQHTSLLRKSLTERDLCRMQGTDENKDKQIQDLQMQNEELGKIIEQMTQDMQMVRQQAMQSKENTPQQMMVDDSNNIEPNDKMTLFNLRREHYNLLADKRRLELENQMLKASADGGEQRLRERGYFEQQIAERDNQIFEMKDTLMKKDLECGQYQARISSLEQQVINLKRERDRLLEVSQNLKVSMSRMEKKQVMESMKLSEGIPTHQRPGSTVLQGQISTSNNLSGIINAKGDLKTIDLSREPRRDIPITTEFNSNDQQMNQLYEEVNQMKQLMAQLKKGNAIGEIFRDEKPKEKDFQFEQDPRKAQRLQELKQQRLEGADTSFSPSPISRPPYNQSIEQNSAVRNDQIELIKRSIEDIQKIRESVQYKINTNQSMDRDADGAVLLELEKKEKSLNQFMVSGMEGYQPNLNMFGSNVFSSIQSTVKDSQDFCLQRASQYGLVNLNVQQQNINIEGENRNEISIHDQNQSQNNNYATLGQTNPFKESSHFYNFKQPAQDLPDMGLQKLNSNQKDSTSRSKRRLDQLKNDYNNGMIDDMFPTKQ